MINVACETWWQKQDRNSSSAIQAESDVACISVSQEDTFEAPGMVLVVGLLGEVVLPQQSMAGVVEGGQRLSHGAARRAQGWRRAQGRPASTTTLCLS